MFMKNTENITEDEQDIRDAQDALSEPTYNFKELVEKYTEEGLL
jgi:hypothetical protein